MEDGGGSLPHAGQRRRKVSPGPHTKERAPESRVNCRRKTWGLQVGATDFPSGFPFQTGMHTGKVDLAPIFRLVRSAPTHQSRTLQGKLKTCLRSNIIYLCQQGIDAILHIGQLIVRL